MSVNDSILAHISQCRLQQVSGHPATRLVVAYSGGIDSSVLLHSLVEASRQSLIAIDASAIVALHINHQLSPQADAWQQHCQQFTQRLGIDFYSETVSVKSQGGGVEAAARKARYHVFANFLQESDCLLLGHHQQDQAETLLFRLCRGAGVKGLAAMPASRKVGRAVLHRPLLQASPQDILRYAKQYKIAWVDDDSNARDEYDRNFLRHRVMPLLEQRWSSLVSQLATTSNTMAQTQVLLNELAADDFLHLGEKKARTGFSIDAQQLAKFSLPRRNNVLRHWCERHAFSLPSNDQLTEVNVQFFSGNECASNACVSWGECDVRYFLGRIYLMPTLAPFVPNAPIQWDMDAPLDLPDAGRLLVSANDVDVTGPPNHGVTLPMQTYQIRWRQGGERCRPKGRQHSQTLKKLLQEYQVETWLRDRVPLLYCNDELVAVGDFWVNDTIVANNDLPTITPLTVNMQWLMSDH